MCVGYVVVPASADWNTLEQIVATVKRLPHLWLADGRALHDCIGDGYTLLRLGGAQADVVPLQRAFAFYAAPFTVLDINEAQSRDIYGYDLILLRPDLHVVWRGNRLEEPERLAEIATGH